VRGSSAVWVITVGYRHFGGIGWRTQIRLDFETGQSGAVSVHLYTHPSAAFTTENCVVSLPISFG
jgi:hypothetical protein